MPSAAVANTALQTRSPANSDSDSESGCSEDARPGSASGQQQQAQSQLGSSEAAGEAGTVSASVGSSGKSVQDQFAKLQRCRASVPVTTVHWHAHPVGALCFSADGTLLLSGGEEAVLVSRWPHAACDCTSLALSLNSSHLVVYPATHITDILVGPTSFMDAVMVAHFCSVVHALTDWAGSSHRVTDAVPKWRHAMPWQARSNAVHIIRLNNMAFTASGCYRL